MVNRSPYRERQERQRTFEVFPALIENMSPHQLLRLEQRLKSGGLKDELGNCSKYLSPSESLREVISRDTAIIAAQDYNHQTLANRLNEVFFPQNGSRAEMLEYLGQIEYCPWNDDEETTIDYRQSIFVGSNNRPSLEMSGLHLHLIKDHHFFEGEGGYRLDPLKVIHFIELFK